LDPTTLDHAEPLDPGLLQEAPLFDGPWKSLLELPLEEQDINLSKMSWQDSLEPFLERPPCEFLFFFESFDVLLDLLARLSVPGDSCLSRSLALASIKCDGPARCPGPPAEATDSGEASLLAKKGTGASASTRFSVAGDVNGAGFSCLENPVGTI